MYCFRQVANNKYCFKSSLNNVSDDRNNDNNKDVVVKMIIIMVMIVKIVIIIIFLDAAATHTKVEVLCCRLVTHTQNTTQLKPPPLIVRGDSNTETYKREIQKNLALHKT